LFLIHQGSEQPERLRQLNGIAFSQMKSLLGAGALKRLGEPGKRERGKGKQ
jgi:hypothetical protein